MKPWTPVPAAVLAGVVLTIVSTNVEHTEYVDVSHLHPGAGPGATIVEAVKTWGWPLGFFRDGSTGRPGEMDPTDELLPAALAADYLFISGLVFGAVHLVGALVKRRRPASTEGGPDKALVPFVDGDDAETVSEDNGPANGGDAVNRDRYGIFKVIATCTSCGNPVVVNGPLTGPSCPSCRKELEIPPDTWESVIGDYIDDYYTTEPGSGSEGTLMSGGLTIKYSAIRLPPPDPACPACTENWDLGSVENGANRKMVCGKCGRETDTYPAPSWLRGVVPSAKQVFFAERESEQSGSPVDAEVKPVALSCPQCGGGLLITAESERTVPCRYCNVDVYLPDGVWLKLHPAKVAKFWMVRFDG
ncbi:MAG: hypothetical protein QUS11_02815 [Candidatus Fermentibacter sp.]|nr:hypothetical protein [Candidatus Fermentibacter sp.]